jgi:DNA-binding NtrC family response regulator
MIEAGAFRADLYHRLSTIEIFVPSLREHVEDIPQLVSHFLAQLARRHSRQAIAIDPDAMVELIQYRWPGNVRELQSVLERGVLLSADGRVRQGLLPRGAQISSLTVDTGLPLKDAVAEASRRAEHEYLVRVLALCEGNVAETARRAGIDRRNLYRKLLVLGIDPTSFR